MSRLINNKEMLEYDLLQSYSNIFCFTTTRNGGYSRGNYATFNCTDYCGDEAEDVAKNRELLLKRVDSPSVELVIPRQTHSDVVRVVDENYATLSDEQKRELLYGVDALVTNLPGYCLSVSTADCVPILLYDVVHKAIGVVHAGWRGTVARIVVKTVETMRKKYGTTSASLKACIGPSISLESFEVGDEVYDAFQKASFDMTHISKWNGEKGKWHIDLWEANRMQLVEWGVDPSHIEVAGICTLQQSSLFFSARRLGIASGRILSGIVLHNI
ncbi:MAG: peptidoglycan editing factor PgeF [Phocaeicola sp.]